LLTRRSALRMSSAALALARVSVQVHPAQHQAGRVARSAENDFTSHAMQRGILLGVIVIVLLEGAGARSGG